MKIKIELATRPNKPRSLLADAVIDFGNGLSLHGSAIWQSEKGPFVVLAGRQYEKDGQRKTFEYLRGTTPQDRDVVEQLKREIVEAYLAEAAGGHRDPEVPTVADDDGIPF